VLLELLKPQQLEQRVLAAAVSAAVRHRRWDVVGCLVKELYVLGSSEEVVWEALGPVVGPRLGPLLDAVAAVWQGERAELARRQAGVEAQQERVQQLLVELACMEGLQGTLCRRPR
jgi:hypothetical protein